MVNDMNDHRSYPSYPSLSAPISPSVLDFNTILASMAAYSATSTRSPAQPPTYRTDAPVSPFDPESYFQQVMTSSSPLPSRPNDTGPTETALKPDGAADLDLLAFDDGLDFSRFAGDEIDWVGIGATSF